jgi:activating signal cointegrator complex subunit 2
MSIISQIQDLFPDLGASFIVKCLDEYNDDIEQVTAHLLEDSLSPYLSEADRSEKL